MNDPAAAIHALTEQAKAHYRLESAIRRSEARTNAAFQLEMKRLEQDRSQENEIRKRMDAIMADLMAVLKKSGTEVRQSS
jgi:hypothetical protein